MSLRLLTLSRRIARVERQMADRARAQKLANCNCFPKDPEGNAMLNIVSDPERFEAEMNIPCPAHEFRNLGDIGCVIFINRDRTPTEESARLVKLVEIYKLRLSQLLPPSPELEYDPQES